MPPTSSQADWRHPDDAYLFEVEMDEDRNFLPNEDGTWFKFTERAEKAQQAVGLTEHSLSAVDRHVHLGLSAETSEIV